MTTAPGAGPSARRLLVTGTDTGVGKTVLSAAVCACLDATYVKPAQSGTDDDDDDARFVAAVTGVAVVTGVRLGEPLAPSVAARRAGRVVARDDLLAPIARARDLHPDRPLVIEGAGGLLVELGTDGTTLADLAAELQAAVVVAVRPGLGTLNHTALTLEACDRRGLDVAGVVVCAMPADPDVATATNLAELERLSGDRLAGVIPRLAPPITRITAAQARAWLHPDLGGTWHRTRSTDLEHR